MTRPGTALVTLVTAAAAVTRLGAAAPAHAQAVPGRGAPVPPPGHTPAAPAPSGPLPARTARLAVEAGGTLDLAYGLVDVGAADATRVHASLDVRVAFGDGLLVGVRFGYEPLVDETRVEIDKRAALVDVDAVQALALAELPVARAGRFELRLGAGAGLLLVQSTATVSSGIKDLPDDLRYRSGYGVSGRGSALALWALGDFRVGLEVGLQAGWATGVDDFQDGALLPDAWTSLDVLGGLVVRYRR